MNCYLIDFENVKNGIVSLMEENSEAYLFRTVNCPAFLPIPDVEMLCGKHIGFHDCLAKAGTKDALDFQLSSQLGFLIAGDRESHYYIISHDKGYDAVCDYWTNHGVFVTRIAPPEPVKEPVVKTETEHKDICGKQPKVSIKTLKKRLSTKDDPEKVREIINSKKTKKEVFSALREYYGNEKQAKSVYNKILKCIGYKPD